MARRVPWPAAVSSGKICSRGQTKTAAEAAAVPCNSRCAWRSALRLGRHAAFRLAAGRALGLALGDRHRRPLVRRRFFRRLAHRRLAGEQVADLVAGERLVFEQALGQLLQLVRMLGEEPPRLRQAAPRRSGGSRRRSSAPSARRRSAGATPNGRGTPPPGSRRRRPCRARPTGPSGSPSCAPGVSPARCRRPRPRSPSPCRRSSPRRRGRPS